MTATDSSPTSALSLAAPSRRPAPGLCANCRRPIVGRWRRDWCPHCHMPLNLPPDLRLENADLAWLRHIGWGALAMGGAPGFHLGGAWLSVQQQDAIRGNTLHVFGSVLGAVGLWFLTAPENPRHRMALATRIARLCAGVAICLWFAAALVASRQGETRWFVASALAVMAVESVAVGLYAGPLAARIPHPGLAGQFRNFVPLLPPFFVFLIVCQFVDIMNTQTYFFCWLPLVGALVGVMLWIAATMVRLFAALRRTAGAAETVLQKHFAAAQVAAKEHPLAQD